MHFIIDADCPRRIGEVLRNKGHSVLDIRDLNPQASDEEIYQLIKRESLILITRDTDFGNILIYPLTKQCGVILLRLHLLCIDEIIAVIEDLMSRVRKEELLGTLTVVRKDRYRFHHF